MYNFLSVMVSQAALNLRRPVRFIRERALVWVSTRTICFTENLKLDEVVAV